MKLAIRTAAPAGEMIVVMLATAAFAALCTQIDLSERLSAWAQPRERFQLDELPLVLLFFACALVWFAWRRVREARAEVARRLRAEASLQQAFDQNRRLAQVNIRLQEDERRHLARELHDELGQCMNAIKLEAVALRSTGGDAMTQFAATSIVALTDRVQAATRDIARRLRPPGIDELGLAAVLEHSSTNGGAACRTFVSILGRHRRIPSPLASRSISLSFAWCRKRSPTFLVIRVRTVWRSIWCGAEARSPPTKSLP